MGLLAGCGLCLTAMNPSWGAGVTLITHGFEANSSYPGWVTTMADRIPSYPGFPGTNFTIYRIAVSYGGGSYVFTTTRVNGRPPAATDSGEILVELDWSQLSGDVFDAYASTYGVAAALSRALTATNLISEFSGHALVELPLHLIGHSRGGSLIAELSRDLGTNGVWVDQVTTLDPYPLNNDGNRDLAAYSDAPARYTYLNVLFADNYWQDLGAGTLLGDPDGEEVSGAYVRQLTDLSGGYNNDHSNVHLWYHATIDTNTPANDGSASVTTSERSAWWAAAEEQGILAGFLYSRLGGGDRLSSEAPLGLGFSEIRDGYNQNWDFGAGLSANRTALPSHVSPWPNLIRLDLTGTNVVTVGQNLALQLYYQYGGAASNVTLQLVLDPDSNPYNGNETLVLQGALTNTGPNSVEAVSFDLDTSSVAPGVYAIGGRVTDGVRSRYLYGSQLVQIVSAMSSTVLNIALYNGLVVAIEIDGPPGQGIVLQSSADLHNWSPLATNVLTSGRWVYTNSAPATANLEFYRAVLQAY